MRASSSRRTGAIAPFVIAKIAIALTEHHLTVPIVEGRARVLLNESMRRLADGDRASFDDVFAGLWSPVRTFCAGMLGHGADADDAAQQAIMKVFDRASSFDPAGDALTWAVAVAAWECKTIRKRRTRSKNRGEIPLETSDEATLASHAPTPEEATIARQLEAAALQALGALSVDDRETLRAAMNDDRDPTIVAATFRKRKERALARLRDVFRRAHGR